MGMCSSPCHTGTKEVGLGWGFMGRGEVWRCTDQGSISLCELQDDFSSVQRVREERLNKLT